MREPRRPDAGKAGRKLFEQQPTLTTTCTTLKGPHIMAIGIVDQPTERGSIAVKDLKAPIEWLGFAYEPQMLVYFADSTGRRLEMQMLGAIEAGLFDLETSNPETRDYLRVWADAYASRSAPPPLTPYPPGGLYIQGSGCDPCADGWPEPIPLVRSDIGAGHV